MTTISFPTITRLTEEADAYAAQYGFRFRQNGDADAFRHAYASAEMTRIFGEAAAAAAGTAYEFSRVPIDGPKFAESNMDLWNNARGREMGRTSTSSQDSAQRARDAVNGGNLITDIGDPRNRYYDDYNTLPTPPIFGPVGVFIRNFDFLVNELYTASRGWSVPRDPLVLDLDGDGIETVGINPAAPVLFDHDADGIKTGTGWIKPDDGLLVLDLNGNGTIDTGRELFGDNTQMLPGVQGGNPFTGNAQDGYRALRQYDSNNDGQINSGDAFVLVLRTCKRGLFRHRSRGHARFLLLRAVHVYRDTEKSHGH
jgi:hypothetical protein